MYMNTVILKGSSLLNSLTPGERTLPTFDRFKSMTKEKLKAKLA